MHNRNLGDSGLTVSEVGMGCNRLGEESMPTSHWVNLVKRAVDLGVTVFDTSESYKWGRSEAILGQALGNRDDVVIATKMARVRDTGDKDFSAARMMQTVEGSLKRLQRDCIDIYQLHSPDREALEHCDWAEGMAKLKEQGKIRLSAVAVNSAADGVWLIEQGLVEVLQITYNIFDIEAEEQLFALAVRHGVGLLCRKPLARGVLTGKFKPGEDVPEGHRAHLDGEQMFTNIERAEDLRPLGDRYPGGMAHLALQFALTPPAISALIPGARTVAQLEENVAASNGVGVPTEVREAIERIRSQWKKM
jgi:aryl-alcohol dehydrogenase-like predicted oxidoreductase